MHTHHVRALNLIRRLHSDHKRKQIGIENSVGNRPFIKKISLKISPLQNGQKISALLVALLILKVSALPIAILKKLRRYKSAATLAAILTTLYCTNIVQRCCFALRKYELAGEKGPSNGHH